MGFSITFIVLAILALSISVDATFDINLNVAGAAGHNFRKVRRDTTYNYLNNRTEEFLVNGTGIPLYPYDLGESYAGLLPIAQEYRIDNGTDNRDLFFWFFPSTNNASTDEIAIWLTGGPGCSSLVAMLQENGPFLWQPATAGPITNPWSWHKLTNIVYIEFPVGVGFTEGTTGLYENETDAAQEFLGFWKSFVDTFSLQERKVYITGESYAGYYIPYITDAMLNTNNTYYFNTKATLIYDPIIGYNDAQQTVPFLAMVKEFKNLFPFSKTFWQELDDIDTECGFTSFLNEWLVFPPKDIQPPSPSSEALNGTCDIFDTVANAAYLFNPCFETYHITSSCPYPEDPVKNPPLGGEYYYNGIQYFNRSDVKNAIHAPDVAWAYCSQPIFANDNTDLSDPPTVSVLPGVIERSTRTLIIGGTLDLTLPSNGTLLAIQNMTWGGTLGFQSEPADDFYVPYVDVAQDGEPDGNPASLSGTGVMGVTITERGLTWVDTFLAGHQGPQWQPAAAFRHFEFLLGRVESLTSTEGYTVSI